MYPTDVKLATAKIDPAHANWMSVKACTPRQGTSVTTGIGGRFFLGMRQKTARSQISLPWRAPMPRYSSKPKRAPRGIQPMTVKAASPTNMSKD